MDRVFGMRNFELGRKRVPQTFPELSLRVPPALGSTQGPGSPTSGRDATWESVAALATGHALGATGNRRTSEILSLEPNYC